MDPLQQAACRRPCLPVTQLRLLHQQGERAERERERGGGGGEREDERGRGREREGERERLALADAKQHISCRIYLSHNFVSFTSKMRGLRESKGGGRGGEGGREQD